MYKINADILIN